jgi:hypothetical protein
MAGEAAAGEVALAGAGEVAGTGLLGTLGAGLAGAGGLALAAAGGYELGSFLDEKLGISDAMVKDPRWMENMKLQSSIGAHVQDVRGTKGIEANGSMSEVLHNAVVRTQHAGQHFDSTVGNYVPNGPHDHYAE